MKGSKYILHINNIRKSSSGVEILKSINFEQSKGEIIGLIGPNGSGKSTTMKVIAGLYKPTSGSVTIKGTNIIGNVVSEQAKSIGVLIEEPRFNEYMTAKNNLMLHCRLFQVEKERIDVLLVEFGLYESRNKPVSKFSLGMRQKLGIVRILLHEPEILILDEPTNGLDPDARIHFKNFIRKYVNNNKSVLISSHLLTDLQELCDRFIFLKNGKMIEDLDKKEKTSTFKLITDNSISSIINIQSETIFTINELSVFETIVESNYKLLPDINKKIIDSGIKLYTMIQSNESLEKIYIDLIK